MVNVATSCRRARANAHALTRPSAPNHAYSMSMMRLSFCMRLSSRSPFLITSW